VHDKIVSFMRSWSNLLLLLPVVCCAVEVSGTFEVRLLIVCVPAGKSRKANNNADRMKMNAGRYGIEYSK
jgi:NADH:ubiquinone oxidoreductase subunit B-like Fe-S oxidoreductase